jgi:hypothetical protein
MLDLRDERGEHNASWAVGGRMQLKDLRPTDSQSFTKSLYLD